MSLDTTTIIHECNVIRRRIQEEFKNLTLNFLLYKPDTEHITSIADALKEQQNDKISQLNFKNDEHYTLLGSAFLGLDVSIKTSLIPPFKRISYEAVFLLNTDELKDKVQAQFNINHLCWHALRLYQKASGQKYNSNIFIPSSYGDFTTRLRENLQADIFSSIVLQQYGHVKNLNKLARQRCQDLFEVKTDYMAENYPYPIACEATVMLLDEQTNVDITQQKKPISYIIELTQEVKETFEDGAIEQWFQFANAAQNMSWQDLDKNKILQTAIYTCEDPFVRSVAYLVSEFLNIDPHPVSDMRYHNPFTDDEANERLHYRLCRTQLKDLLNNMDNHIDNSSFTTEIDALIKHQNTKLKEGIVIGWCSFALNKAKTTYANLLEEENLKERERLDLAQKSFQESYQTLPWMTLKELETQVISEKRKGTLIDKNALLNLSKPLSGYDEIFKATFNEAE